MFILKSIDEAIEIEIIYACLYSFILIKIFIEGPAMGQALGIQQHTEEIWLLLSRSIPSSAEAIDKKLYVKQ